MKLKFSISSFVIIFSCIIISSSATCQDFNTKSLGIGIETSVVRGFTNLNTQYLHAAESLSISYLYDTYTTASLEVQKGTLSGGGLSVSKDRYGRMYTNNYLNFLFHVDVQLGTVIDIDNTVHIDDSYSLFKKIYFGVGDGYIFNSNKVQRTNIISENGPLTYIFPGQDVSKNFVLSIRCGYSFPIYDNFNNQIFKLNIGFANNYCYGNGLDGYNDPPTLFKHKHTDIYMQLTTGLTYLF